MIIRRLEEEGGGCFESFIHYILVPLLADGIGVTPQSMTGWVMVQRRWDGGIISSSVLGMVGD